MTKSIVLTELSDLARYSDEFANDTPAVEAVPPTPAVPPDADPDALIQAISRAARELQRLAHTDASARRAAEDVLATHRRLQADADSLRKLVGEAHAVSVGAATLGERAFLPESKAESEQLAVSAAAVETIAAKRLESLTARELEIVKLIVERPSGASSKEVAAHFGISPRTVDHHRARILEKLGVKSLTEMIALVRPDDLVD